jgi:hypothetical protein
MSSSAIITPEMVGLLKKVVRLTREGQLPWEATADPATLIAPLGGDYSVRVQLVPDFDYDPDYSEPDDEPVPDQVVTIAKGRRELFSLDRRDFADVAKFSGAFADVIDSDSNTAFGLFRELWDRAYFKAAKIDEEVQAINRLLDAKIKTGA